MSYTYAYNPGLSCSIMESDRRDYELMLKLQKEKSMNTYPVNPSSFVSKKSAYWTVSTYGDMSTFETEEDAIDTARRLVAKNDQSEVAVLKLIKFVRVDKPVVVEEI